MPACNSDTLTIMPPQWNAMLHDMTLHPVTVYRHGMTCYCAIHQSGMSNNFPLSGSEPTKKSFLDYPHTHKTLKSNTVMMAFSEKLGRKCDGFITTVTGFETFGMTMIYHDKEFFTSLCLSINMGYGYY